MISDSVDHDVCLVWLECKGTKSKTARATPTSGALIKILPLYLNRGCQLIWIDCERNFWTVLLWAAQETPAPMDGSPLIRCLIQIDPEIVVTLLICVDLGGCFWKSLQSGANQLASMLLLGKRSLQFLTPWLQEQQLLSPSLLLRKQSRPFLTPWLQDQRLSSPCRQGVRPLSQTRLPVNVSRQLDYSKFGLNVYNYVYCKHIPRLKFLISSAPHKSSILRQKNWAAKIAVTFFDRNIMARWYIWWKIWCANF